MNNQEKINDALQVLRENNFVMVFWNEDDVRKSAEDLEIELTDDQITNILYNLEAKFDASIGINWDTIEEAIQFETGVVSDEDED